MFSGIIETIGLVTEVERTSSDCRIIVQINSLPKIEQGTSIAINGVCLTVSNISHSLCTFDLSSETLNKTNLNKIEKLSMVNIEYPLTLNKFISGHITTGHVDATAHILSITQSGKSWEIKIKIPENIMKFIVKKGSISIDGVSLTVNDISQNIISIMIIPHTFENTIIKHYKEGNIVNIEVDYIAKHIERLKK